MSTQLVKETTNNYHAAFAQLAERSEQSPSWLMDLRLRAIEHFNEHGFPTTKQEDYKYTNVAAIAKGDFAPFVSDGNGATSVRQNRVEKVDAASIEPFTYAETNAARLVFVNGVFQSELSRVEDLGDGIVATDLQTALHSEHAELVRAFLPRGAETFADDAFTSLNTAFLESGAFIYVPREARAASPIQVLFVTDTNATQKEIAVFPRVLVVAERNSEATIVEDHISVGADENGGGDQNANGARYFSSPVVEFYVDDEAHITHYKLQRESASAFHVARTRAEVGSASRYDSTTINLGGALVRHNINLQLRGEGSESWIDGLFLGDNDQHTDTHSLINHTVANCVSHQSYKGILNGRARSVFNGRIFVHRAAQKTDAYQSNKNLLMSDEARVDTKPQLEIFADDVKCSHGATVGQLNQEELFYLLSRGLQPTLARNLLTYGFAEQVVDKIKIDSIKQQLDAAILNRLHAQLEA